MPETGDDRRDAIAVMAWAIGRGMGDTRMIAQEQGRLAIAYPNKSDAGWRVYERMATSAFDGLLGAGFTLAAPTLAGSEISDPTWCESCGGPCRDES